MKKNKIFLIVSAVVGVVLCSVPVLSVQTARASGISLLAHATASANWVSTATTPAINTTGATLLVAQATDYGTGWDSTTDTISDSNGNTWHHLNNYRGDSSNITIWYAYDHAGSPLSVGAGQTFSGHGSYITLYVSAYGGTLTGSNPFDAQNGSGSAVIASTIQAGSITPSQSNELIISGASYNGSAAWSVNSSFVITDQKNDGNYEGGASGYLVQTGATAVNPTWTSHWASAASIVAAFKAASSSPSVPTIFSFTANPTSTNYGSSAVLSWSTSGATSASVSPAVGSVAVSGSTSVTPATTTTYTLTAANSVGSATSTVTVTVIPPDTTPPSIPGNLIATAVSSGQINLSWTASTDNVGVAGYTIYRGGMLVGTSTMASYADVGLLPSTQYSYTVAAFDAANNVSGQSAPANATTQANSGAGTPIPLNTWVNPQTNGFPEQVVSFGKLVYAPALKESVMLEQYHGLGSEPDEAMVGYNLAANRWDVLSLGGNFHNETTPEAGHAVGMFTFDTNNNSFIYYCCHSGSNATEWPYQTWQFDPLGQVGREKQTAAQPGDVQTGAAAFDAAHNVYVLFSVGVQGTWTYNPTTNVWIQQNPSGTLPPASSFPSMTYDSANQKIYLFVGGDLYTYDVSSTTWTLIAPNGTKPSARTEAAFAYDSTDNIFLMFGGNRTSDGSVLNDTWAYNPTANTWSQLSPANPPATPAASFSYLTYDSDDNAFIMVTEGNGGYAGGSWTTYAGKTWLYRYAGGGPNIGSSPTNPQPTSGSLNKNITGWANEPVLASDGSTLYAGWIETGQPFDQTNNTWPHAYVSQFTSSTWNGLGSSSSALDSEMSGDTESHMPSLALVGGTPWLSWYKYNDPDFSDATIYAKYWNGLSWVGGSIGRGSTNALGAYAYYVSDSRSQMAGVGSTPYIAFLETDESFYLTSKLVYVKYWNGSSWVVKGTGSLNKNSSSNGDIADSVSIASDGTNPIVAWTEYQQTSYYADTVPQVYVDQWNGSSWVALGGSLNLNPSDYATDASVAYLNGQPYVAWTERTQSGNNQVFVNTWNGSSWSLVGSGTLNKDTNTGWAFRPNIIADSGTNSIYVAWVEQQNLGQKAQTYVSQWNGSSWSALGGTLNADPVNGSAERISLAVFNGQPVASWGEASLGSMRQVYVKQWNGNAWGSVSSTAGQNPDITPPIVSFDVRDGLGNPVIASSTISGNLTFTFSATDPVVANEVHSGIASVTLFLDGNVVASSMTTSSVTFSLSTEALLNTNHTVVGKAIDHAGNLTSSKNFQFNEIGFLASWQ